MHNTNWRNIMLMVIFITMVVNIYAQPCDNCMDGMPMDGCPWPEVCGFTPFLCVNCSVNMCPDSCKQLDCTPWSQNDTMGCMDGMPMGNCPYPGTCGKIPLQCSSCIMGNSTQGCPNPDYCGNSSYHYTPTCYKCLDGRPSVTCPKPELCGFAALSCVNCMSGMNNMPGCPYPDYCTFTTCTMQSYFDTNSEVCLFFPQWMLSSSFQWFGGVTLILLACLFREGLIVYRTFRIRSRQLNRNFSSKSKQGWNGKDSESAKRLVNGESNSNNTEDSSFEFITHLLDSLYYVITLTVAYGLMLIVMTYNVQLCVAVIVSSFIAHFICSYGFTKYWRHYSKSKQTTNDTSSTYIPSSLVEETKMPTDPCCADLELDDD